MIHTHKHHIVPRHMGGTDEESNLIVLTIKEHAEAHWDLYVEHGRWQDELAYLGLSGVTDTSEGLRKEVVRLANTGNKYRLGKKHTDEARANMSAAHKGKTGTKNYNYKGPMIGTDPETGEILHRFEGRAAAEAAGFSNSHIYGVINGKYGRKTHKGCHWTRGAIT